MITPVLAVSTRPFWIAKTPVNGDGLNTVERSPKISEQLNSISNSMANNRVAPS